MAGTVVGLLLAAVAAAVPILVAAVHGIAIIMLAVLAAGAGGGIYTLALKKCLERHGSSRRNYIA